MKPGCESLRKKLSEDWAFSKLNNAQKADVLSEHVYYEIITALGIPACDISDESAWEDVHFARLGHCRVLVEFFAKKPDDSDTVMSSHYGFSSEAVISEELDVRLNKDLFHLTYARLRDKGSAQAWPSDYLKEIHKRCIDFVEQLLEDSTWKSLLEHEKWEELLCILKSEKELLISRPDRNKPWRVKAGDDLPGGYSTFRELKSTGGLVDDKGSMGPHSNAPIPVVKVMATQPKQ